MTRSMTPTEPPQAAEVGGHDPAHETNTNLMEMPPDTPDPDRCNAITSDGRCRKYPVGGAGEGRCRFHGGASTGPDDTAPLEGNDHAAGNPGGGAPEGNGNAEIHDGFADWRQAYQRFDEDTQEAVDRLAASIQEQAAEHASDVAPDRRERLAREQATLYIQESRAGADVWCALDGSGPGRGLVVETEVERDGETITVHRMNPALRAANSLVHRRREIAEELRLYPGLRPDEDRDR